MARTLAEVIRDAVTDRLGRRTPPAPPAHHPPPVVPPEAPTDPVVAPVPSSGDVPRPSERDRFVACAKAQINKPYVWATHGPNTFDCSGLVGFCYKQATGRDIGYGSVQQFQRGASVNRHAAKPGDVFFWDTFGEAPGHNAIYIGHDRIIHALNEDSGVVEGPADPQNIGGHNRFMGIRDFGFADAAVPQPQPETSLRFPNGTIQTRSPGASNRWKDLLWDRVRRWEPLYTQAGNEFGVAPLLLAAFSLIETDANHYRHGQRTGTRADVIVRGSDSFDNVPAVGIMQIKLGYHDPNNLFDGYTPEGNLRLGAKLLAAWMRSEGSWEAALRNKYFPGNDPQSGTTQDDYIRAVRELIAEVKAGGKPAPTPDPTPASNLTFGRVPPPKNFQQRTIAPGVNSAWDDLGPRQGRGIVLHRMLGTLDGTDDFFRGEARDRALTDFGIGLGKVYRWTQPGANVAPYASGPANGVKGDAADFLNRYRADPIGVSIFNRDCRSIEIAGNYNDPVPDADYARLVETVAYVADQFKIPWNVWPKNRDGVHCLLGHSEITADKPCPGAVVYGLVPRLIDDARLRLRSFQEGPA